MRTFVNFKENLKNKEIIKKLNELIQLLKDENESLKTE